MRPRRKTYHRLVYLTSASADMQTEVDAGRATLRADAAPPRARGAVKAVTKSPPIRARAQAANNFMLCGDEVPP